MEYAKLIKIELKNFMSIADAEMQIGAITNICGYNDQGKSAIRTALAVCMYDSDSIEQIKYIKDGTEFFKVTCIFADGVSISKEKRIDGTSIWEMRQGTEVIYTNATGDKVTAVEDVPEPIAKYWGVYYDEATGQYLNVRIDRDPYLLVDTSGGDNYKILNPLLHSDVLSRASADLIADSNICKSKRDTTMTKYNMLKEMLETKEPPTQEMLNAVQSNIAVVAEKLKQQEEITAIKTDTEFLDNEVVYPQLNTIDSYKLQMLTDMQKIQELCDTTEIYPEIDTINTERLHILEEMMAIKPMLTEQVAPQVSVIDMTRLMAIKEIFEQSVLLNTMLEENAIISESYAITNTKINEYKQLLVDAGCKVCQNCGSIVE